MDKLFKQTVMETEVQVDEMCNSPAWITMPRNSVPLPEFAEQAAHGKMRLHNGQVQRLGTLGEQMSANMEAASKRMKQEIAKNIFGDSSAGVGGLAALLGKK